MHSKPRRRPTSTRFHSVRERVRKRTPALSTLASPALVRSFFRLHTSDTLLFGSSPKLSQMGGFDPAAGVGGQWGICRVPSAEGWAQTRKVPLAEKARGLELERSGPRPHHGFLLISFLLSRQARDLILLLKFDVAHISAIELSIKLHRGHTDGSTKPSDVVSSVGPGRPSSKKTPVRLCLVASRLSPGLSLFSLSESGTLLLCSRLPDSHSLSLIAKQAQSPDLKSHSHELTCNRDGAHVQIDPRGGESGVLTAQVECLETWLRCADV